VNDLEYEIRAAFEEWSRTRQQATAVEQQTIAALAARLRPTARTLGESLRYTAERVVATLLALWLARGLFGW
jgi:hypothetical protein